MKIFDYFTEELKNYVRKEEFEPYKAIIKGFVALVLTAFVTGLATILWGSK